MAGMKGRSGGARPGAGRKKQSTEDYQGSMRSVFEEVVTREEWYKVVLVALSRAKAGDKSARDWMSPWIVGKVPDKVELSGQVTLKGYVGFTPDDWDRDTRTE